MPKRINAHLEVTKSRIAHGAAEVAKRSIARELGVSEAMVEVTASNASPATKLHICRTGFTLTHEAIERIEGDLILYTVSKGVNAPTYVKCTY